MFGEFVQFPAADGWKLQGFLVRPKRKSKRAVIFMHGMGGYFWSSAAALVEPSARTSGAAFFTFNNRGMGKLNVFKRKVGKQFKRGFFGTAMERFEDCVPDIDGTIRFLKRHGFKDFVLVGHSTGCQKITFYQAKRQNKNVKGLILLAPADDVNAELKMNKHARQAFAWAKRKVRAGKAKEPLPVELSHTGFSAQRYYNLHKPSTIEGAIFNYRKPLRFVRKVRCPVLALFGRNEEYAALAPDMMLHKIAAASQNPLTRTELVPGDHGFSGGEKEVGHEVLRWLKTLPD